ncbi:MAG TPA: polysaccharide biosynthesis protein [Clostridiaceae bacterium]|nr:polysaccharide biosynthesis protein [Clostridiaceae bacterium]
MEAKRRITPNKFILIVYDISCTIVAAVMALFVYYEGNIPELVLDIFKQSWFVYPIVGAIVFALAGFFDQMWAFASTTQYLIIVAGSLVHTVLIVLILQFANLRLAYAVYILYWFISTLLLLLIRMALRWYRNIDIKKRERAKGGKKTINVLIVGAGQAGAQLISELQNRQILRKPVAIVDDNPLTHTYKNMGVPVLGNRHNIPELVEKLDIDEIILAVPSASRSSIREILKIANETSAKVRMLPYFSGVLDEEYSAQLSDVRDINIEDLLGRDPIELEMEGIKSYLRGKSVLVTGGGGSIGSELARQIAEFRPSVLILLDIYENNVYDLQQELKAKYHSSLNLQVLIGSVRDKHRLEQIFAKWHPNVVFHAAAHKHVPLMEDSPEDAVKNNLLGTTNVGETAGKYGAEKMVLISTDKAVNPTNVMGATKRLAEIVILSLNKKYPDTSFSAVRFGNVLGSNGSVIPLFEKQIKQERRVTVTHPEIERYFMTIPEASRLVLQSGSYAKAGEIFVLDMGKPVKILDLAKELIRLSGYKPETEIPIDFIGLRPGEKMYEELYLDEEHFDKTAHDKIFILQQNNDIDSLIKEIQHLLSIIRIRSPKLSKKVNNLIEQVIHLINLQNS